jgi:hypothetical protein
LGPFLAGTPTGQIGQPFRVLLAGDQGRHHGPATLTEEIRQHTAHLEVGILQRLCCMNRGEAGLSPFPLLQLWHNPVDDEELTERSRFSSSRYFSGGIGVPVGRFKPFYLCPEWVVSNPVEYRLHVV